MKHKTAFIACLQLSLSGCFLGFIFHTATPAAIESNLPKLSSRVEKSSHPFSLPAGGHTRQVTETVRSLPSPATRFVTCTSCTSMTLKLQWLWKVSKERSSCSVFSAGNHSFCTSQ